MSIVVTRATPSRGIELGYAEITANPTNFTTIVDITGLSVTVTVGTRPILVDFFCGGIKNQTADKYVKVQIMEGATQIQAGVTTPGVTTGFSALYIPARIAPSAGSHTYKISALTESGNGVMTSTATSPTFIRVVEC